ncbi:ferredoxin--NADP reductase [Candidatus Omnitrophota bacterium]
MIEFETKVIDVIKRAPGVKSFRFEIKENANFKAGQFFFVTIKIGGEEKTKHFSFSNSPTEARYIEFTKRITVSPYSQALDKLKAGDWARLKMPVGLFTLKDESERVAFLSGGIGITPIRSMCKFATDKSLAKDLVLLYSNRTEEGIIFRQDFNEMQKANKRLRVIYTLTSPDIDKKKWSGRTGYINAEMIKEEIPDYEERVFYTCGPPAMVASLINVLKDDLKLSEDRIRSENFTGYQS